MKEKGLTLITLVIIVVAVIFAIYGMIYFGKKGASQITDAILDTSTNSESEDLNDLLR